MNCKGEEGVAGLFHNLPGQARPGEDQRLQDRVSVCGGEWEQPQFQGTMTLLQRDLSP